jgi:DNA-binding MarR family transcriptional regulator
MTGTANTDAGSSRAWRRRRRRHHEAMRAAQVRRLVRVLNAFGPLPRERLARISHADHWREGCLDVAISEGIRQGKLRRLPFDFLAANSREQRQSVSMPATPTDEEYRRLLELRTGLRRFLRWSEGQARAAGLTPAQHQLLLAIRGHADPSGPTIRDVAGHLLLRHHSAVGLVDRAEAAGLVTRTRDPENLSAVRLRLTDEGSRQLEALSELHLEELAHLAPTLQALWGALEHDHEGGRRRTPHPAAPPRDPSAPPSAV